MSSCAILWKRAEVRPTSQDPTAVLELRVDLSEIPDRFWRKAFRAHTKNGGVVGQSWNITSPEPRNRTIAVTNIKGGDADEVHATLEWIVARANGDASKARKEYEEKRASKESRLEHRRKDADDLARRFRGYGYQSRRPPSDADPVVRPARFSHTGPHSSPSG